MRRSADSGYNLLYQIKSASCGRPLRGRPRARTKPSRQGRQRQRSCPRVADLRASGRRERWSADVSAEEPKHHPARPVVRVRGRA